MVMYIQHNHHLPILSSQFRTYITHEFIKIIFSSQMYFNRNRALGDIGRCKVIEVA